MGAQQSSDGSKKLTLANRIDHIAASFILTNNFQDIINLSNPEYCNKLVILTSDILQKYLTPKEIEFLKDKKIAKEPIAFFNKTKFGDLDVKNPQEKKEICIGIAKFYVQIFHIFNAIAHTINPVYTYKDQEGNMQQVPYEDKNKIPSFVKENAKPGTTGYTLTKINFCNSRVKTLMKNIDPVNLLKKNENDPENLKISNNICETAKKQSYLVNEPGFPELEMLYNDVYNYETGKFDEKSKKMQEIYNSDLKTFYQMFTGKSDSLPKEITKFGEIPLSRFKNLKGCKKSANKNKAPYNETYEGTLKEKLFKQYTDNVKIMMSNIEGNQNKLMEIINKLFVYSSQNQEINESTTKHLIIVNPKLNQESLTNLVNETRKIIISLYATCEENFLTGLKIFEAIVANQGKMLADAQISSLSEKINSTVADEPTNKEEGNTNPPTENSDTVNNSVSSTEPIQIENKSTSNSSEENSQQNNEQKIQNLENEIQLLKQKI
tara:strand:- start:584 stop:2062 length:1479 start_codon:yes stop_codon:yes gene_type:complete